MRNPQFTPDFSRSNFFPTRMIRGIVWQEYQDFRFLEVLDFMEVGLPACERPLTMETRADGYG